MAWTKSRTSPGLTNAIADVGVTDGACTGRWASTRRGMMSCSMVLTMLAMRSRAEGAGASVRNETAWSSGRSRQISLPRMSLLAAD